MFKPIFDVLIDSGIVEAIQHKAPIDLASGEMKTEHAPSSDNAQVD